jgi:hypothetical protein
VPTTDTPFRGRLKALSIADVFVFLKGLNRPGRLMLSGEDAEVAVDLRGGFVVRASSSRSEDRLEEILLRAGWIGEAQRDEARRLEAQDREMGMGRALIASGALSPKGLLEARREQARRIVAGLFEWTGGEYHFDEGHAMSGWSAPVDLPIFELVAEGIRQVRSVDLFRERMPSPDWVFEPVVPGSNGAVRLEPQEEHLLSMIDGASAVDDLAARTEFTDLETRRILFLLLTLGRIRPRPVAAQAADEGEPTEDILRRFNGMYGKVYQYMTIEMGPISSDLLSATLRELEGEHAPLFSSVKLGGDGTLDEMVLQGNLRQVRRAVRRDALVQGLSELLYRELLVLRQSLGPEHERRILNDLRRDGLLARPLIEAAG